MKGRSVVQQWVSDLTLMMQSVLLTAIRGPDGIHKNHVSKRMVRWLRRCILLGAFENDVLLEPYDLVGQHRGGSFIGPSIEYQFSHDSDWRAAMSELLDEYLTTTDELPHHFQLHFIHAAEILGHYHPTAHTRNWWYNCYKRLCNDMHLRVETREALDKRLGDNEDDWGAAEEVRADQP